MTDQELVVKIAEEKRNIVAATERIAQMERMLLSGDSLHDINGLAAIAYKVARAYRDCNSDKNYRDILPAAIKIGEIRHDRKLQGRSNDLSRINKDIIYNNTHAGDSILRLDRDYLFFDYKCAILGVCFAGSLGAEYLDIVKIDLAEDDSVYVSHEVLTYIHMHDTVKNTADRAHITFKDGPYIDFINEAVFQPILKYKEERDREKAIKELENKQSRFTVISF